MDKQMILAGTIRRKPSDELAELKRQKTEGEQQKALYETFLLCQDIGIDNLIFITEQVERRLQALLLEVAILKQELSEPRLLWTSN